MENVDLRRTSDMISTRNDNNRDYNIRADRTVFLCFNIIVSNRTEQMSLYLPIFGSLPLKN